MSTTKKLTGPQQSAAFVALLAISALFREKYRDHRRNAFMDAVRVLMVDLAARAKVRVCRMCGCTERSACTVGFDIIEDQPQGCSWIAKDCCSHPSCKRARDRESDALMRKGGRRRAA